ncbi:hypothetical protein [Flavobacterium sp.]|uniref:hypothetical protein n=1 Tax=Flavobacterium sp. TaxID=239 RepID=UPI0037504ED2
MSYIKETLCRIILLVDSRPTFTEKATYFFNLIGTFGPMAYVMDGLDFWFRNNQQFSSFILICLMVNMIVGVIYHHKMGSFDFVEMFKKNVLIWFVLIVVYMMLEMLRLTAGNNFVGEGFKIIIQVTTLLYPISKVLKNVYVLSNKQFPPAFIMDRIYNFEKNGDLNDLFDNYKD